MAVEDCSGVRGRKHYEGFVAVPTKAAKSFQVSGWERTVPDKTGDQFRMLLHGYDRRPYPRQA